MTKSIEPKVGNSLEKSINLDTFLDKIEQLRRFLRSSSNMSMKSKKNVKWYCDYRVKQYYKRYLKCQEE